MKKEQAKRIAARKFARELSAEEVKQTSGACGCSAPNVIIEADQLV